MAQKSNKNGKKKPANVLKDTAKSTLDGSILTRKKVRGAFPFLIFLVLLGLLYISNGYYAERMHRTKKELTEKNSHSAFVLESEKSRASKLSTQSALVGKLEEQGLREAIDGVKKITVDKEEDGNDGE